MLPRNEQNPPVTLRTLASHVGLSHVTVSLALRNSPKISKARREQIQALAQQMGYRPNAMAAALAHHKRLVATPPVEAALAWLNQWPDPRKLRSSREFDCYWRGAAAAAEKFGYRLEEFRCGKQMTLARIEKILTARGIHGILLPPHPPGIGWEAIRWERFSAVRFGRSVPDPRLHIVTSDQVANAMLAFKQAQQKGYRRIGFITDNAAERGMLFQAGYLMAQARLPVGARLPVCVLGDSAETVRRKRLGKWLATARPDAVLTDLVDAREVVQDAGYRVPDDLGLAAMSILDGNADAGIDQHPEEIGRTAVLLLLSLIRDHASGAPSIFQQTLVEGSWVDGSTMPDRTR